MSADTDSLGAIFSQMRVEIRDKFQTLRIKLNQREQELSKRVSEMETNLRSQSEGLLSDLDKLKRTQKVLEDTLDSEELAGTQEATLSLIRNKISLLESSYADIRGLATFVLDTGPLELLMSSLGKLSPPGTQEAPSLPPAPKELRMRRSHTPEPFSDLSDSFDLSHRPTRYSQHIDSFHSRPDRSTSLYMRSDSSLSRTSHRVPRTISESGQGYMTPQPIKKATSLIGKIGKSKK